MNIEEIKSWYQQNKEFVSTAKGFRLDSCSVVKTPSKAIESDIDSYTHNQDNPRFKVHYERLLRMISEIEKQKHNI